MKSSKRFEKIFLFVLATLIALPLSAQNIVTTDDIKDMVNYNIVPTFQKTNVKGTPYIAENFVTGSEFSPYVTTIGLMINF